MGLNRPYINVVLILLVKVASCTSWCRDEQSSIQRKSKFLLVKGKSLSVSLRSQKSENLSPSVTYLPNSDCAREALKQRNILERVFESSFLTVSFIFNFFFLVSVQWAFSSFWCTPAQTRLEMQQGVSLSSLWKAERGPHLYINSRRHRIALKPVCAWQTPHFKQSVHSLCLSEMGWLQGDYRFFLFEVSLSSTDGLTNWWGLLHQRNISAVWLS